MREFTSLWIELGVRLESLEKEAVLVSLSVVCRNGSLQPVVEVTDEPVRVAVSEEPSVITEKSEEPAEGMEVELFSITSSEGNST